MTHQSFLNLSDAELELHIEDCGKHFIKAHGEGDMASARRWLELETQAVARRSPAQIARMESCYFAHSGDTARRQAA